MGERCLDECCLRDYGVSEDFVMQVRSMATCTVNSSLKGLYRGSGCLLRRWLALL